MRQPKAPEERVWRFVQKTDTCWLWTGCKSSGYGRFFIAKGVNLGHAHRFMYELLIGPIPDGMHIDHLCRVRHCVNPAHLEVVDCQTNVRRGDSPGARNLRRTHCIEGHEMTPENTVDNTGRRTCRMCRDDYMDHYRHMHRADFKVWAAERNARRAKIRAGEVHVQAVPLIPLPIAA